MMIRRISTPLALLACSVSTAAIAQEQGAPDPSTAVQTAPADAPAGPAETAPENAASTGGLEEIVVTATRREERLQDIPVTVTAITNNTLAGSGLSELRNLTQVVPAFNGGRNIGVNQPVIRGVGSSGISIGDESNVATYIDGIYQADPFSTHIDLVEIERVEVLRGPQGTVFGRNATGGLINVITPDPSFDTRGRIAGRYGRTRNDANDYDLRAYITGGLTDTIAADFAGLYRKNDGYIKDLVRGGHLGQARVVDLRSKLLFQPSDTAKIVLMGEYADSDTRLNAVQPYKDNTAGRTFQSGVNMGLPNPNSILPTGPWEASLTERPELDYERYNLALRTQFEFDGVNLETSTGYMHTDIVQFTDSDASNIFLSQIPFTAKVETISQEVRLLSNGGGPFNWILGAYAFHLDGSMDVQLQNSSGLPGAPVTIATLFPEMKTTSFAGFAEGTYELVDRLFLTLGGRFTTEKRKFRQKANGVQLRQSVRPDWPAFGTAQKSFDKWTYRVALRYNFADDANIYASYGTGFKSGVFNAVGTSPIATDPETINAAEIGLKIDPLPWLRTNLSIFHYDYKDLQVQARDAAGVSYVLQNAATAEVYGGELEVTAAATDDLNLRGSVAYTHGEYTDFPEAQTFEPRLTGGNTVIAQDVSGNKMIRAPRYTFNLGFDWGHDLAGGRFGATGNVFHSAKVYHDFLNVFVQKAHTMVSGELSWTTPDEAWRFSLWATNLTNAKVAQQIRPGAFSADLIYERPRRVGVGAELKF